LHAQLPGRRGFVSLTDDLNLSFQTNLSRRPGTLSNNLNQLQKILRACFAGIDDKIPGLLGDNSAAYAKSLQAELIDKLSGKNRDRVLKDAPGAGRRGLRLPALLAERSHAAFDLVLSLDPALQDRREGNMRPERGATPIAHLHLVGSLLMDFPF